MVVVVRASNSRKYKIIQPALTDIIILNGLIFLALTEVNTKITTF
jgi:hypothetical protein